MSDTKHKKHNLFYDYFLSLIQVICAIYFGILLFYSASSISPFYFFLWCYFYVFFYSWCFYGIIDGLRLGRELNRLIDEVNELIDEVNKLEIKK